MLRPSPKKSAPASAALSPAQRPRAAPLADRSNRNDRLSAEIEGLTMAQLKEKIQEVTRRRRGEATYLGAPTFRLRALSLCTAHRFPAQHFARARGQRARLCSRSARAPARLSAPQGGVRGARCHLLTRPPCRVLMRRRPSLTNLRVGRCWAASSVHTRGLSASPRDEMHAARPRFASPVIALTIRSARVD